MAGCTQGGGTGGTRTGQPGRVMPGTARTGRPGPVGPYGPVYIQLTYTNVYFRLNLVVFEVSLAGSRRSWSILVNPGHPGHPSS